MSGERGIQSSDTSGPTTDAERDRTLTIVVAAAAVLFVVLGIGSPLVGQRVFLGTDSLARVAPWKSVTEPPAPTNVCIGDTIDAVVPQRAEFRNRSWGGDFPLWSPSVSGGAPLGAVPDSGMLSPMNISYWILPLWLAPAITKLIELAVAIGFSYLFLRRLSLGPPAALMGGLAYAASGFMVVWTNWPHTLVAALLPALFWATERFLQERTIRAALPISVVAAVMLLQGFPAVAGWGVYALLAYVAVRGFARGTEMLRRIAGDLIAVMGALVLGLGVAAVQVVPFLYRLSALGVEQRSGSRALPSVGLATMAVPEAFGSCGRHGELSRWGPLLDMELNVFAGVVVLVLVLVGVTRRTPDAIRGARGFFAGAAIAALVIVYVDGPVLEAVQRLPVFDINPIGRLRSVLGFFLAVLAAMGFDRLARRRSSPRAAPGRDQLVVATVWLAALGLAAVVMLDARTVAEQRGHLADFNDVVMLPIAIGLAAVAAVTLCYFFRGRWRTVILATLPFLFLAQALPWVWSFWPRSDREDFYPDSSAHEFLSEKLGGDRFVAEGLTMYPFAAGMYGLRSVTGHAFTDQRWKEALAAVDPGIWRSRTYSGLPPDPALAASPMFDRLAARYFATTPEFPLLGSDPERISAPAGELELRPNTPIRGALSTLDVVGVGVVLARPTSDLGERAELLVEVMDDAGTVRARGTRLLPAGTPPGDLLVPLPVDAMGTEGAPREARVTLQHASASVQLVANALGEPVLTVQRGRDDGLEIVFNDRAVIYERNNALPRIRWSSASRLIAGKQARLDYLANQPVEREELVLSEPGPEPTGLPAALDVVEDSGDTIRVRVDAQGAGYLTIADPLGSGWAAKIDGRAAEIVEADHAGGAVFVESGEHEIVISYVPDGWHAGMAISVLSLVVCVALWIWGDALLGRLRSTRHPVRAAGG